MNDNAGKHPIDFIISTGDNIYGKGVKSVDDPQWKTKFENVYTGEHIQKDWYPIFGNHDYLGNVPAQLEYAKKNPRWKFPDFYYVIPKEKDNELYDFFMIDTNLMVSGKDEEMLIWLEKALSESNAKWKIVVGHHMIRSHGVYGDQKFMMKKLISGAGGGSRDTSWGVNTIFSATNGGFMGLTISNQVMYLEFLDKYGEVQFAKQLIK